MSNTQYTGHIVYCIVYCSLVSSLKCSECVGNLFNYINNFSECKLKCLVDKNVYILYFQNYIVVVFQFLLYCIRLYCVCNIQIVNSVNGANFELSRA